jgi:serine/threonine protein kinase
VADQHPAGGPAAAPSSTAANSPPLIPDHALVRRVGSGAYGEVWLARNVMGSFRAVKIVHRRNFETDAPYEREFAGIKRFEPVSRNHPALLSILHIGRSEPGGYFYYIMEAADDDDDGQQIQMDTYVPKTLARELSRHGRLPPERCLDIALALVGGLAHLHHHGLVHRDIKPANLVFLNGSPRIADIGLVTGIGSASLVGTPGYLPPEGPGLPSADLYSLGKVLYEMCMGLHRDEFPALPESVAEQGRGALLMQLNRVILKACETNAALRYQSAGEMHAALSRVRGAGQEPPTARIAAQTRRVSILYKAHAQPDVELLRRLAEHLGGNGCEVFYDQRLAIGVQWAQEIERRIRDSDAVIVLLSTASIYSEMIAYEVETAHQAAQEQGGQPHLLPVRLQLTQPLPDSLARILDPLHAFLWQGPQDDERLFRELSRALDPVEAQAPASAHASAPADPPPMKLESIGGAVPLESQYYVERPTDHEFQTALARGDSIVLVKGARQMGKTSLLARGLQRARESGATVVFTDFQKLNAAHLAGVDALFLTLGQFLADQLDLEVLPEDAWDKRRSPNTNFERYLRREVLGKLAGHFVWGLDEVDRLFACDFGSEVFGLFRSWHNERALDPDGPWSRLTLAIAYATEAHLFITDINQSPFNVGTRLTLEDFTLDQVRDLNRRYGAPLASESEVRQLCDLLGGQPYLVRRALNEIASGNLGFDQFVAQADHDEGVFGDHLRRILVLLAKDAELREVVRGVLRGEPCANSIHFYRLRSAGVMAGDSTRDIRPRCRVYATYLQRQLL